MRFGEGEGSWGVGSVGGGLVGAEVGAMRDIGAGEGVVECRGIADSNSNIAGAMSGGSSAGAGVDDGMEASEGDGGAC